MIILLITMTVILILIEEIDENDDMHQFENWMNEGKTEHLLQLNKEINYKL